MTTKKSHEIPAGLVVYEANPTQTNEETGEVRPLNPKEYPTQACCDFVKAWLEANPLTRASGPFTITSEDESVFPWKYSILFREIETPNGTEVDPGLWYGLIQIGGADLDQPIRELVGDAAGSTEY